MNTKEELLKLLIESSDYLSGEELAKKMGVSRNAIWKSIIMLEEKGIKIDSRRNKGYKLASPVNFINKVVLDNYLDDDYYKTYVFDTLDSTSTYIKQHLSELEENSAIFAREQTSGRGRLNRKFFSPLDSGIYFSILVKPKICVDKSIYLTVLSAVSVYEAVSEVLGIDVGIKWINDLYKDDKKVCGILAEGAVNIDYNYLDYCIIGIGINVTRPLDGFNDLSNIATYLTDSVCDLNKIASSVLKKFKKHYLELLNSDLGFIDTYISKQMLIGKAVEVCNLYNEEAYEAKVIEVDKDCKLVVEDKEGKKIRLNSGEVRIILNK